MNKSQLQQMRNDDITQVDRSDLVNICDIHIDDSLPATVKARIYFDKLSIRTAFAVAIRL